MAANVGHIVEGWNRDGPAKQKNFNRRGFGTGPKRRLNFLDRGGYDKNTCPYLSNFQENFTRLPESDKKTAISSINANWYNNGSTFAHP